MLDKSKLYFKENCSESETCLLGLSGGPDSLALFYLLLEEGILFAVCHVDHGWRGESEDEAKVLEELCHKHQIPFYGKRVENFDYEASNLEDRLRERRYQFFQTVYQEIKACALLLGHHMNDQAETVLKRILEGSSLFHISGIPLEVNRRGMKIVRPLLFHTKNEIVAFLHNRQVSYFHDPTNYDEKYLRARMRKRVLPDLEENFGKNVQRNLVLLAESMKEIHSYIIKRVSPLLKEVKEEPFGLSIFIKEELERVELEYLLRALCEKAKVTIPRGELNQLMEIVLEKKSGKKICRPGWEIVYKRRSLLFISEFAKSQV